jgi:hypothetical protein
MLPAEARARVEPAAESCRVELAWVLVDGQPQHVSAFASVPPRRRPSAACPVCRRPVTMKLGAVLAHHVAHRPGDECAAARGESALHLNTKLHLAAQLRTAGSLRVVEPCQAYLPDAPPLADDLTCARLRTRSWSVAPWDEVAVELAIGSRRPDISLLSGGKAVAAIEVLVSHAVDEAKAADLRDAGLPWIEVRADPALYSGGTAWTSVDPLRVHRSGPDAGWTCEAHETAQQRVRDAREAAERQRLARVAEEARRREYHRANREVCWLVRIADFYYPTGKKFRELFEMVVRVANGAVTSAWLETASHGVVARARQFDRASVSRELNAAFVGYLERMRNRGAIVDSPMRWERPAPLNLEFLEERDPTVTESIIDVAVYSDISFPRRYLWSVRNGRWFLAREHAATRWRPEPEDGEPEGDEESTPQ